MCQTREDLYSLIWIFIFELMWQKFHENYMGPQNQLTPTTSIPKLTKLLTASTSWKLDGHSLLANKESGFRIINRHSWFKQHCYALKKLNCFRSMLSKRINIVPAIFPSTHFIDSCSNSFNTCPKSKTSNFLVIFQINNIIGTFKINIKP